MLSPQEIERYDRQIRLLGIEGQEKLKKSSVLVVGIGGLGTVVTTYLAYAGIGRLVLVDDGFVELSNLNRQILYAEGDIGKSKASVACKKLQEANSKLVLECYAQRFDRDLGERLVKDVDIVVDALDNWETRMLLNEICVKLRKPLVHAGVEGWYGQVATIIPGKTPCLYCIRPYKSNEKRDIKKTISVVGVTPGLLGILEVAEVLKLILGIGETLQGKMLFIDLLNLEFKVFEVKRNPECPICKHVQ
jgi:molybdopterin/thiamine biosynthesis adenylyltransferase